MAAASRRPARLLHEFLDRFLGINRDMEIEAEQMYDALIADLDSLPDEPA